MNSSSSFGPEREAERSNGYDSDGLFNGAAATSAAHHSSHGHAGQPSHVNSLPGLPARTRDTGHELVKVPWLPNARVMPLQLWPSCLTQCAGQLGYECISSSTHPLHGQYTDRAASAARGRIKAWEPEFCNAPDAGNGAVRGQGASSKGRSDQHGGIPSAPGSFTGGFSGFDDGAALPRCSHHRTPCTGPHNKRHRS